MSTPPPSRRDFLAAGGALAAGAAMGTVATGAPRPEASMQADESGDAKPKVTAETIAAAEALAGIGFTAAEREMMAADIDDQLDRLRRRQSIAPPGFDVAPALRFDPRLARTAAPDARGPFTGSTAGAGIRPPAAEDVAFAPVSRQAQWIRQRALTSVELTRIYLDRLQRFGPHLQCVITLLAETALERAADMDREIASGRYRGPLHGIPWGAKDLLDAAGTLTTWGAEPYRDRVAAADAAVVTALHEAGAVLVAKLTLGALAYNDIWFGGKTRNPWSPQQGSSGSSAGSAAATAAGLVGFSLGTETYGSIVSPCMRCGATGLRPTFGRVPRTGAMPLCWSLDKIGPICRTVEDCMLVLRDINRFDAGDPSSLDVPLAFDGAGPLPDVPVGYAPAWFEGERAGDLDRAALEAMRRCGVELVEIDLPDWPYDALLNILFAEAAASFEELTRSGRDDELTWQEPAAWPNTFRQSWFIPAIEYVQATRFRRQVMEMMADRFDRVAAIVSPSFAASLLLITNNTGHPSLTLRCGFKDDGTPHGITLWGRLFDEGTIARIGMALEQELGVWDERPTLQEGPPPELEGEMRDDD